MKWLSVLVLFFFFAQGGLYQDPQGFLWYKDAPIRPLKKKKQPKTSPSSLTYTQKNEALSKAFEASLHQALEEPTLDNVKKVQALQHLILQRSEKFAQSWMLAYLMDGLLYDEKANPNPRHLVLQKQEQEAKRTQDFQVLSKRFGVFLVWKEECRYCHDFIPILQDFCTRYGFDLIAVSPTGTRLPGIKSLKDNGMIHKVNTHHIYPAAFLVELRSKAIYPIAWGLSSISDLETNTSRIIGHLKEKV